MTTPPDALEKGFQTKLQHETWPIERLTNYANNPRKNDHAIEHVAEAIKAFGFRVPVIVKSDGIVVDGHLRLKAARKLGLKEIPVILADDLSDAEIKAFRLSVNRMADLADWDEDLLRAELNDLAGIEFDLELLGFDAQFLGEILEIESPEPPGDQASGGAKPPKTGEAKRFSIALTPEMAEKARVIGAGNIGDGVRVALTRYTPKKRGNG
jgi:disulfide oxidoreductase YuzD